MCVLIARGETDLVRTLKWFGGFEGRGVVFPGIRRCCGPTGQTLHMCITTHFHRAWEFSSPNEIMESHMNRLYCCY